jgi:hypothetical protein
MDDRTFAMHIAAGLAWGEAATCGRKIDYKSEESAERAARAMMDKGKADKPLEAYPCAWCAGWHIGRATTPDELRAVVDPKPLGLENHE